MKILVAEDDTTTRKGIAQLLEKMGHEVVECNNGDDVLGHLFKGDLPQLIFLDWMMPGTDGIEVCKKIRENQQLSYTHIIMVTSKSDPADVIQGLRAGANDYLLKPINVQEFQARLQIGVQLVELNQLVTKQRMQIISASKMAVLGEMASGISHEINNPLTIIDGHVQRLIRNPQLSAEEIQRIYSVIVNTTDRIAKIIKALKSFAADGEQEPFEKISAKKVIENALSFCTAKLKSHGIIVIAENLSDDFQFMGRSVQLCQVMLNLIDNAYLAVAEKGEKWIKFECAEDSKDVMISITDSGSGIPEYARERIMHPFFTTRPFGKGTGLGLSISKGIVESHKGKLTLDTTCVNTRFVISIPKSDHR